MIHSLHYAFQNIKYLTNMTNPKLLPAHSLVIHSLYHFLPCFGLFVIAMECVMDIFIIRYISCPIFGAFPIYLFPQIVSKSILTTIIINTTKSNENVPKSNENVDKSNENNVLTQTYKIADSLKLILA